MNARTASNLFLNYTKIEPALPAPVWMALRLAVLAGTFALATVLVISPDLGLKLFWGIAIPLIPALVVVAPGLWRQVCPMAFLNQMPRMGGFSRELTLPAKLRDNAFTIAVGLFFLAVAVRVPVLNHAGAVVATGIFAVLAAAFFGGVVFKGRSGWCGTFCPLGPIQRDYGHAPLVMVRNGYCSPCLGCQKNCYDFNPRAAIFADLGDDDPAYAGQRRFFMGMMPGLILGYFLQGAAPAYGEPLHAAILLGAACASVGFYYLATNFLGLDTFRAANLFAAAAVLIFYIFAGPIFVKTAGSLLAVSVPQDLVTASQFAGVVLAAGLIGTGWRNNHLYREASAAATGVKVDETQRRLKDRLADGARVEERKTGKTFAAAEGQTLLEAMEAAGVPISFGCRSGLCGADPVAVCEGSDNLSPMSDDERATLRRLGLEGSARLACMCQVQGPVIVDIDARNAKAAPLSASLPKETVDKASEMGIGKVVIVGNGVAGLGAAEALRRASPSVEITVIADEPHHFYNRMAIGRVIYGRTAMDGLHLLPPEWYGEARVDVWRNTIATAIDPKRKVLRLGTGEELPYDRLILATGAKAATPGPEFEKYPNTFVLRTAEDAAAIRTYVQTGGVRRAVVIGGGVLGVEAADALRHIGVSTTILQRSGRLMDRQLDENGALRLTRYLENMGIAVVTKAAIAEFAGDDRLEAVKLADGSEIRGDLFIASMGAAANVQLARDAGLSVGRGILVDAFMRTSDPDIYAIGDVAELPGSPGGLWPIGSAQASAAVSAMLGGDKAYAAPRIVLQLKCDGIDLRSFGDVEPKEGDCVVESEPENSAWWRLVERNGTIAGAVYVGPPGSARAFTSALKEGSDKAALMETLEG